MLLIVSDLCPGSAKAKLWPLPYTHVNLSLSCLFQEKHLFPQQWTMQHLGPGSSGWTVSATQNLQHQRGHRTVPCLDSSSWTRTQVTLICIYENLYRRMLALLSYGHWVVFPYPGELKKTKFTKLATKKMFFEVKRIMCVNHITHAVATGPWK